MKHLISHRSVRLGLGAVILSLGLLSGPFVSHPAHAYISGCDTDPIVYLSNGVVVTMDASINAPITDVSSVSYVLHVPMGTSVTSTVYDAFGYLEQLTVVAEQWRQQYTTDTTVVTVASGVQVTATSSVTGIGTKSTSGYSGQTLHLNFMNDNGNN